MKAYLTDFQIVRPRFQSSQEHTLEWIARAHAFCESRMTGPNRDDGEEILSHMRRYANRFGCSPSGISGRGHDLEDFLHLDWERMRLFNFYEHQQGPNADLRTACFEEFADGIFERLYTTDQSGPPSHLIHVTCTGYASPSAAQKIVDKKGWHSETTVTHAYHMGCSAAVPALRIGVGILGDTTRVDIVHTEFCSLHFDPKTHTPEQFVVQSLFADGHVRYRLVPETEFAKTYRPAYEILMLHEELVPDSLGAMGWRTGASGMKMTLNASVPTLIGETLTYFLARLFAKAGLDMKAEFPNCCFAIHPGGPKIIEHVGSALQLSEAQMRTSREVFFDFGNMSSATLPHIWERMLSDSTIPPGALVVSLAFAPGLTISGALLKKAHR